MQHLDDRKPGQLLREYRHLTDTTLAELADRLKTSKTTLSQIENGRRPVSIELLPSLVEATGIPAAKLRPDLEHLFADGVAA